MFVIVFVLRDIIAFRGFSRASLDSEMKFEAWAVARNLSPPQKKTERRANVSFTG